MTQAMSELKKLGTWEDQANKARTIIETVFDQNDWTSEEDQFARKLATEIATIPPWDFRGRVGALSTGLTRRYELDFSQKMRLQAMVLKEIPLFVLEHSEVILKHTSEYVQNQMDGEPFDSEQIARLTTESEGIFEDFDARLRRMIGDFEKHLTDDQREIVDRDRDAYKRRKARVIELRAKWRRGEWRPGEWGLTDDETIPGSDNYDNETIAEERPRVQPCDESTWSTYTHDAIERYAMDAGQRESANSILRDMSERARSYRILQFNKRNAGDRSNKSNKIAQENGPICDMFEELLTRTESIPRYAQRYGQIPPNKPRTGENAPGSTD
jgi:hypothetical protein